MLGRETGTCVALKRHGIHYVDQAVANCLCEGYVTGRQHPDGLGQAVFHLRTFCCKVSHCFRLAWQTGTVLAPPLQFLPPHSPLPAAVSARLSGPGGGCYGCIEKKTSFHAVAGYDFARTEYHGGDHRQSGYRVWSRIRAICRSLRCRRPHLKQLRNCENSGFSSQLQMEGQAHKWLSV